MADGPNVIGAVSVAVQADLGPLSAGFQEAQRRAQTFDRAVGQSMQSASKSISGATMSVAAVGKEVTAAAHGHQMLSTQAMAAAHSMRGFTEMMFMGVPIYQAVGMEANNLTYAMSHPGGLTAAMKEGLSAFKGLLSPMVLVAGGAGAVAAAFYFMYESIKTSELELADLSDRIKVTINQLHGLQSNATLSAGINASDFLAQLQKVGDLTMRVKEENSGLAALFRANGMAISRDVNVNLARTADLVKNAATEQQKYLIAQEAGFPATRQWVQYLSQGGDAITRAANEAHGWGTIAERDMIDKARKFDTEWAKTWDDWKNDGKKAIIEASTLFDQLALKMRGGLAAVIGQDLLPLMGRNMLIDRLGTTMGTDAAKNFYDAFGKTFQQNAAGGLKITITYKDLLKQAQDTQTYVSALGKLATVDDIVRAKEAQLTAQYIQTGVSVGKMHDAVINLVRVQAEYDRLNRQTAIGVFDLAAANKAAGDQMRAWIDEGLLDPKNVQQMANAQEILAARTRALKQAAEDANPVLKAQRDAEFELAQAFRTSADAAAAAAARQLYGNDYLKHLDDAVPRIAAMTEHLKQARDMAVDFGTNLAQGLAQGKSFTDSLNSALQNVVNTLIQMAVKQLVYQAFGALLGGGGGARVAGAGAGGLFGGFLIPGILHGGGMAGDAPSSGRLLPSNIFVDAPKFHSGKPAFGPNEMPAILDKREEVGYPSQLAAKYGGSKTVQVRMTVDLTGANGDATIKQLSGQAAVAAVQQGIDQFSTAQLPVRLQEIQLRGG